MQRGTHVWPGLERQAKTVVDETHASLDPPLGQGPDEGIRWERPAMLSFVGWICRPSGTWNSTCALIDRHQNAVFQGVTGFGRSYCGCAVAKQVCTHLARATTSGAGSGRGVGVDAG